MSEYRLEMRGVCKSFPGVKALDQAQLRLRPGTVHALMGENGAGKSTLMKCMFGIYKMDQGEIFYEGKKVHIGDPLQALHMGIAMVHQELQPIPERSVAENVFVGRYPVKKVLGVIPVVDRAKMFRDTERVLREVRMNFDPKQRLGELSVSQMQSVEIAKAVSADCKVLILDEPTSSLTAAEVEALFRIIADLKAKNVSIVYISHKMDEICGGANSKTKMARIPKQLNMQQIYKKRTWKKHSRPAILCAQFNSQPLRCSFSDRHVCLDTHCIKAFFCRSCKRSSTSGKRIQNSTARHTYLHDLTHDIQRLLGLMNALGPLNVCGTKNAW